MASFLSRRVTTRLLQKSHLRTFSEWKPYEPKFFSADSHTSLSSDTTTTTCCRPPALKPTNPSLLSFISPHSISTCPNPSSLLVPHTEKPSKPDIVLLIPHSNPARNPFLNPAFTRHFSSSPPDDSGAGKPQEDPVPAGTAAGFRHQEITGPTVERDVSALANETRQALEGLRKGIYDLSTSLAVLGVAQLALGAWIVHAVPASREVLIQGLAAFAFPFSLAFLLRRTLKPLSFFHKMEDQGRLQILTLALQVSKNLNLMFSRIRVVSLCCVVGISAGSLAALWMR